MTGNQRWKRNGVVSALAVIGVALVLYQGVRAASRRPPQRATATTAQTAPVETGRWREAEETRRPPTNRLELERLATVPYCAGSREAPDESGVTTYESAAAYRGLNLFTSGHAAGAVAMDMRGNVLHTWRMSMAEAWPDEPIGEHTSFWRRAYWFPNGDVLAIFEGVGLIRIDRDSNLLWSYRGGCHHEAFVYDDGSIYVLSRKPTRIKTDEGDVAVLEDFIDVLTPDGKRVRRVSLMNALQESPYADVIRQKNNGADLLHTNAIYVFDGSLAEQSPLFRRGNVLVSMLQIHSIAIVDMDTERVIWLLDGCPGDLWLLQHDPQPLPNGHMLIFANDTSQSRSAAVEFDPLTAAMTWKYDGGHDGRFSSDSCGAVQRLPNGDTLLTVSDAGYAVEVTPAGRVVWEFYSPYRAGRDNELIATLFEVVRVQPDYFAWLTPPANAAHADRAP